jgi:aspartate racemase
MPKHIGIVACSVEGAALCYRTINSEGVIFLGKHFHPEVSLHTYPLGQYMDYIYENRWEKVAELMISSSKKLASIGADFIICPDNTIHQAYPQVVTNSPIPWLHIAEEVAKVSIEKGYRTIGVLGTKYLMEGPVYPGKFSEYGLNHHIPDKEDREKINRIIFDELVNGIITEESRNFFYTIIEKLKKLNCDAVVLGCTEIPLIVEPDDSPLPTLDSTRILSKAAVKLAVLPE